MPEHHFEKLIQSLSPTHSASTRRIVAVAGAPGSGKSTLAEQLIMQLNHAKPDYAALLPMDGFHYDDALLEAMGRRHRKGAPDTFDVGGLNHTLARLRARNEPSVAVPVFDRSIEIARAGARLIAETVELIVVEGNYLLLQTTPWQALQSHFDVTVFLDVPEATLRERLLRRWQDLGLPADVIAEKVDGNDMLNVHYTLAHSRAADYQITGS